MRCDEYNGCSTLAYPMDFGTRRHGSGSVVAMALRYSQEAQAGRWGKVKVRHEACPKVGAMHREFTLLASCLGFSLLCHLALFRSKLPGSIGTTAPRSVSTSRCQVQKGAEESHIPRLSCQHEHRLPIRSQEGRREQLATNIPQNLTH